MFIIAVLRRQIHPKALEIYCIAAFGAGILTTLPPQFMGVIGYSIYFGCWYVYKDPTPYIWGFYYGPQLVVSVTNVLLAICIRVSLSSHFRALYGSRSSDKPDSDQQDSLDKSSTLKGDSSALSVQNSKSGKNIESPLAVVIATAKFDETSSGNNHLQNASKSRRESSLPSQGGDPHPASSTRSSIANSGKPKKPKPQGDALRSVALQVNI
ncbi:hypothetical protein HDU76_010885 [Blyttiomyces sp. JEL0837]|nr:hypothetical protein HDU76_010885 [Blyttiomyces sp. JEL0837]